MKELQAFPAEAKVWAADARWWAPLAAYRLSGRRTAYSRQLYRAGVMGQRIRHRRLPGMTSPTERAYFTWHAREEFRGRGAIVDLGSWLGSTTATLASGLVRNPHPGVQREVIHAFDQFRWEGWMDSYADITARGGYAEGESFLAEFERIVEPWRDRIRVHEGDLLEQAWTGKPIEVLLIDAMKSWDLAYSILTKFYGDVLVDGGYVIHQDFSNAFTPWIHLVSYRLRDHLVPFVDVPRSETIVFKLVRPIDDKAESLALSRRSFDAPEIEAAFEFSLRIARTEKHSSIRAARAMLLVYDGDVEQARAYVAKADSSGLIYAEHADIVRAAARRAEAPA